MSKYKIKYTAEAKEHIEQFKKFGQKIIAKKIDKLLNELREHPRTGTGKPEPLKYLQNCWSRRIDKEHRLVYKIEDDKVIVLVLSAYGHYEEMRGNL